MRRATIGGGDRILRSDGIAAGAILMAAVAWLLVQGRPAICACGHVALWHGALDAGNSQHLADWYTPSHILHGILFFAVGWWLLGRRVRQGVWLVAAVAIEAGWEIVENSPAVIDRYRTATIALGYSGDSVVNSAADIGWMVVGFLLARALPWRGTLLLAVLLELAPLAVIRDNLTLNIVMLLHPIDAIRIWQGGA